VNLGANAVIRSHLEMHMGADYHRIHDWAARAADYMPAVLLRGAIAWTETTLDSCNADSRLYMIDMSTWGIWHSCTYGGRTSGLVLTHF